MQLSIIPSKVHHLVTDNIFPMLKTQNLLIDIFDIKKKKTFTIVALTTLPVFLTIQMYYVGIFINIILFNTFLSIQTEFKSVYNIFNYSNNT